jgi:hypothetical protein
MNIAATLYDPKQAALLGAATGAVKGLVVGVVAGKLLLFTALGAAGGAATGAALSWFGRRLAGQERFDGTQEAGA